MKSIKERADERYPEENPMDPGRRGFFAGANSEHNELTRWNDQNDPPKSKCWILIKSVRKNGEPVYEATLYYPACFKDMEEQGLIVFGWRNIHE